MATFTRTEILEGLQRLGELAQEKGITVQLTLMGGAVMVLAFEARLSTRDVDVFIRSPREARIVRELAKRVASERDWNDDWLNDAAKGYLVGVSEGQILYNAPGIEARAPALEQLLAMKLSAWRDDVDVADARRLLQELAISNHDRDVLWGRIEPYLVLGDELTAQYAFLDLWESMYGTN
ncbi:MAG TPA: nucleotidyltransferase [Anaerolineales bacterium]